MSAEPTAIAPPPSAAGQRLRACLKQAAREAVTPPEAALAAASEAMGLAERLQQPLEHGRAAWLRCLHLARLGRFVEAVEAADLALPLLQAPELIEERCATLRAKALAGSEANIFDAALNAANELVLLARERNASTALDAAFALAACFERMGDPWQAERVLSAALQQHGPQADDFARLGACNGLSAIGIGIMHRLLDSNDRGPELQALLPRIRAAAEQARALLDALPQHPSYQVPVLGNLAEVMLHQGDRAAALPLLHRAVAMAQECHLRAYIWRGQVSLADWHLAERQPERALALARGVLEQMGEKMGESEQHPQTRIRAHRSAYRACRALGRTGEALAHLEVAEREERRKVTRQMRAQSALFVSRAEAQQAQWQADEAQREAQRLRAHAAEAAASAERDPLTGLGNRRHLERRCAELLPVLRDQGRPLALAQIDIDNFKAVNDRCGHAIGDRVLVLLAQMLGENMRTGDVLVRHGGEEFVIVLPDTDADAAAEACERLRERVAALPWQQLGGPDWAVTISIGLAVAPAYELAPLLARADAALYGAKRGGRNRLCAAPR